MKTSRRSFKAVKDPPGLDADDPTKIFSSVHNRRPRTKNKCNNQHSARPRGGLVCVGRHQGVRERGGPEQVRRVPYEEIENKEVENGEANRNEASK